MCYTHIVKWFKNQLSLKTFLFDFVKQASSPLRRRSLQYMFFFCGAHKMIAKRAQPQENPLGSPVNFRSSNKSYVLQSHILSFLFSSINNWLLCLALLFQFFMSRHYTPVLCLLFPLIFARSISALMIRTTTPYHESEKSHHGGCSGYERFHYLSC